MSEEIRVLAVRQPWASLIVEGLKTIEVRNQKTTPGKIAIYSSASGYTEREIDDIVGNLYMLRDINKITTSVYEFAAKSIYHAPRGYILGTVEIDHAERPRSWVDFEETTDKHFAPTEFIDSRKTCFWHLKNSVKFNNPVKYTPKRGTVVWSKTVLPEGIV